MEAGPHRPTISIFGPRPDGTYLVDTERWASADPVTPQSMFSHALAEAVNIIPGAPDVFIVTPISRAQTDLPCATPKVVDRGSPEKVVAIMAWLAACKAAGCHAPLDEQLSEAPTAAVDKSRRAFYRERLRMREENHTYARAATPVKQVLTRTEVIARNDGRAPVTKRHRNNRGHAGARPPTPITTRIRSLFASYEDQAVRRIEEEHPYARRSRLVQFVEPRGLRPVVDSAKRTARWTSSRAGVPYFKPFSRKAVSETQSASSRE
jgi:hypothetical protein